MNNQFLEIRNFIEKFESYANIIFKEKDLKIGFRIFDGKEQTTLNQYLLDYSGDYGEFAIYFIKNDENFNSFEIKVNHDLYKDKIFIGKFSLDQLRGCCGIGIMFHVLVDFDLQNNKFGQCLTHLAKLIAKEKDFTQLICTDIISNKPQQRVLNKFGFKTRFNFKNSKTKNIVELRSVDLNDEQYYDVIWKKKSSIFQKYSLKVKKLLKKISLMDVLIK